MTRTTLTIAKASVEQLNAIINLPAVAPALGGVAGELDIRDVDDWDRMIPLTAGNGAMLFLETEPGMFRIDFLFVPGQRTNLDHARGLITFAMRHLGAKGVYGFTPKSNKLAQRFVENLPGFKVGETEDGENIIYAVSAAQWPWLT